MKKLFLVLMLFVSTIGFTQKGKAKAKTTPSKNLVLTTVDNISAEIITEKAGKRVVLFVKNEGKVDTLEVKKIETKDSEIPRDILNEWLTMIELPQQEKGVIIKKENHTYKIFEDKFEDKKVSIIVSDQKTTININGKEYKIRIITTSDHGPGCPGPGRNPCF